MVTHIKILSDLFGKGIGGWFPIKGIDKWVESGMSSPAGVKIYVEVHGGSKSPKNRVR